MSISYLKKSIKQPTSGENEVQDIVKQMLSDIETNREPAAIQYAKNLDNWTGNIVVTEEEIAENNKNIPQAIKDDIAYAFDNVTTFAQAQLNSIHTFEEVIKPGVIAGQIVRPMQSAGCYVPGGRYAHIASAIMSIATAKVAGVEQVVAVSPPRPEQGINPYILYTMSYCGADKILALGGVQGIAAMAYGLFDVKPVNILVGPGNRFVAEAKRLLFGKTGIDIFAGPTEIAIIADKSADANIVATDLVGQAEHGLDSPAWLITDDEALAKKVIELVPEIIQKLPEDTAKTASVSWENYGEVVLCSTADEMVQVSDQYAAEHLQVQTENLDWWLENLNNYGSLFLGEETTVAFGDKCSGPNHVLPTKGAARYTGGLSVAKFVKVLTYQKLDKKAVPEIATSCARISRLEGMEAHARTADVRLAKYFPDQTYRLQY